MEGDRQEGRRDSSSMKVAGPSAFISLGDGDFHARLASARGVSLVLFTAPHCAACRAWKHLLPDALAGIADSLFAVDVSVATGLARYYGIFHLPALHLYRHGLFHAEVQCALHADTLRQTVAQLLREPAREEP